MIELIYNITCMAIILLGALIIISRTRRDLKVCYVACIVDIVVHAVMAGILISTGRIVLAVLYMLLGFMWVSSLQTIRKEIRERNSETEHNSEE